MIECKDTSKKVQEGHELEGYPRTGAIRNLSTGEAYMGMKLPDFLLELIEAGGAIEALRRKLTQ